MGWFVMIRETGDVFPVTCFRDPATFDGSDDNGILHIRRPMVEGKDGLLFVVWDECGDLSFRADSLEHARALLEEARQ